MQNVLLTILLLVALALIIVVLMQRSEGGGLGIGGGGGAMTGRQAGNAMTKLTWILGGGFFVLSLAMTIMAAQDAERGSLLDRVEAPAETESTGDNGLLGGDLLPPTLGDGPAAPPKDE